jgi:predicted GNAT family acetyltransferase
MSITVIPLTPEYWPAFEDLFGAQGACYGCWCTYFRLSPGERKASNGEANRMLMRRRVEAGPPPGILAMEGDRALGWLQVGPRSDVPQWNSPRRVTAPLADAPADDPAVWAMSCFFIRRTARGRGVTSTLVEQGLDFARGQGARMVEACPMEEAGSAVSLYVGPASTFRRAGFVEVTSRKSGRPLMRYVFPG